jgi:hypothetical protein
MLGCRYVSERCERNRTAGRPVDNFSPCVGHWCKVNNVPYTQEQQFTIIITYEGLARNSRVNYT